METRHKMVVFGNTLFPSQVRKKKLGKRCRGLYKGDHNCAGDYGTLNQSYGSCPTAQSVSQQDASCQTEPSRPVSDPSSGEQRYDEAGSLNADINDIIYSFRSVTTIHGVQHAAAARNRSFRRRLWGILVTLMAIFLTWFLFQQLSSLSEHQIRTTTTFDLRESIEFPAVTLCNLNQYNKNRVPDNYTIQTVIFYMSAYSRVARELDPNFTEPDMAQVRNVSGQELLDVAAHAAPTLEEFLIQCRWKGVRYNCSALFHPTRTPQGMCYTFDMVLRDPVQTARVGEWAGLEVMLDIQQQNSYYSEELEAGVKVVVHRSGDHPFPKRYGWHVRPGVFASVALTQHNRLGLPKPYKAYKNRYCENTDSPLYVNPLKRYPRYTSPNCLEECAVDRMVRLCGCRAFNDAGNDTICSSLEMLTCYIPHKYNQTTSSLGNNQTLTLDSCDCPEECNMVSYTAALSYADFTSRFEQLQLHKSNIYPDIQNLRASFINLRLFFESMSVDTLTQEPAVSILDILGTVGGQMGIFLGCSILSIIELIEMGLLISIRCSWEVYYTVLRSTNSRIASLARKLVEVAPLGKQSPQKENEVKINGVKINGVKMNGMKINKVKINEGSQTKPLMTIPECHGELS